MELTSIAQNFVATMGVGAAVSHGDNGKNGSKEAERDAIAEVVME